MTGGRQCLNFATTRSALGRGMNESVTHGATNGPAPSTVLYPQGNGLVDLIPVTQGAIAYQHALNNPRETISP